MELIVLLIVFALLLALGLGPVALIRANAANKRIDELRFQMDRLADQLTRTQTQTRLNVQADEYERERAGKMPLDRPTQRDAAGIIVAASAEPESPVERTAQSPELDALPQEPVEEKAIDASIPDGAEAPAMNTLDALRAARQRVDEQHTPASNTPTKAAATEPDTPAFHTDPVRQTSIPIEPDAPPTRRLTLEEVLAGKVFVWIGAVALVLTAVFLLKLGFDSGIITEPVRVIGAGVFGLVLLGMGEWARKRSSLTAQALCGASVAVLYATILSGHNLYGLFGSTWAFGLMAVITAGAVVLSLRHGPAVAILGMVGGFMLPPILAQDFASKPTGGMVLYLIALEVGILAVTGRRGWFSISTLTLVFTVVWSLGYTLIGDNAGERTLTALLIIGTAAAYLIHTARLHRDPTTDRTTRLRALGLSIAATCCAITVVAILAARGGFMPRDLWMLGLVAAGVLLLARIDRRYLTLPFVIMGLSLLVLFSGATASHMGAVLQIDAPTYDTLSSTAIGYGGLFLFGGYLCLWRSTNPRVFTLLSVIAGPAFYAIVIYAGYPDYGVREVWWPSTLVLAAVYALAAWPMFRRRSSAYDWPIAGFALTSFGLLCVTIVQGLNHPQIAVCLALIAAVAALIDKRLFIRPLLIASCAVAALAAVLLVSPGPFRMDIGQTLFFNELLPMYVLSAFGFGVIAWCAHQAGEGRIARTMTWLTVGTLGAMLVVLTRHGFQPFDFTAQAIDLYESSAYACILMLGALLGLFVATRLKLDAVRQASVCIACIGAAIGFIGALIPGNPIVRTHTDGGWGLAMGLAGLYLLPAWLMWLWSRRRALVEQPELRYALRAMSMTLIAVFAALQVRNAFHADHLHAASFGMFECATYAVVWMLLGGAVQLIARINPEQAVTRTAGRVIFSVGLATALLGNAVILNPLWNEGSVGWPWLFNGLWYLLGPSILVLAVLARRRRARHELIQAKAAGFTAIAISFLFVSLLVRQGFSGDGVLQLNEHLATGELYAYSLAWVLFGSALLVSGIITRLDTLRYGSLAVLLLAVGKVFLIDTANLENLYRVFSFFGLGVTLVGLGYLYQRLIFRRTPHLMKGAQTL